MPAKRDQAGKFLPADTVEINPLTGKPKGKPRGRPFKKGSKKPPNSGRKKGVQNKVTRAAKDFADQLLRDPEYQENLRERILKGRAGPVELYMWNRIIGKPKETIEVQTAEPLFQLPLDAIPLLKKKKESEDADD